MRRTQIQIDENTHAALRRASYETGRSMSSLVRETLSQAFSTNRKGRPASRKQFSFVAVGRSDQRKSAPISERHDDALVEAYLPKKRP